MNPSWALGICDRCGWKYKLSALSDEYQPDSDNVWRVCSTCFNPSNPLADPEIPDTDDIQSLEDPRPETDRSFRSLSGWAPAGNIAAVPIYSGFVWRSS